MKKLIVFISILYFGCEEKTVSDPPLALSSDLLHGTWVDMQTKTDTLTFDNTIGENYFHLSRGKEMRNGYLLPKRGGGLYEFKLKLEVISVYNLVSSCYCFADYYFKVEGAIIKVENFYDPAKGDLRSFKKL